MATAIVPAAPALAQQSTGPIKVALQEFQNNLNAQQKAEFFASTNGAVQDTNAVLIFTAQVDCSRQRRGSRCLASRMQGTLESVERFSRVVDTFVSSNPSIAALVWGSLRFTVLCASHYAAFFDKLSTWFMQVQAYCPRFKEYEIIYPESKRLQNALCAFYATMIDFCTKAIQSLGETGFLHLAKTMFVPFEAQFSEFATKLQRCYQEVKEEIRLASDQAAHHERQLQRAERNKSEQERMLTRMLRQNISKLSNEERAWRLKLQAQDARREKERLLDRISTFDWVSPFKRERKKRYGSPRLWLEDSAEFQKWIGDSKSSTFWLTGILGSGKTVLTAAVIDSLLVHEATKNSIRFFFCQHDDGASLKFETIVRSLTRQNLTSEILPDRLKRSLSKILDGGEFERGELKDLLLGAIKSNPVNQIIVIDGFDEMDSSERDGLLWILRQIQSEKVGIKMFLSSRADVELDIRRHFSAKYYRGKMEGRDIGQDISAYIQATLEERCNMSPGTPGRLAVSDPSLLKEIEEALSKGAEGMFLWVYLSMEDICSQKTDDDKRQAIYSLPKDLPGIYIRVLRRIVSAGNQDIASRMFYWAAVAKRPLSIAEMREAIAVRVGQKELPESQLITDVESMVIWCNNLLAMDEEDRIVRLAHYSVKDFLRKLRNTLKKRKLDDQSREDLDCFNIPHEEDDQTAGEICCVYLSYEAFDNQAVEVWFPPKSKNVKVNNDLQPLNIARNSLMATSSNPLVSRSWSLLDRYIRMRWKFQAVPASETVGHMQLDEPHVIAPSHQEKHAFLAYASEFWVEHTRNIDKTSPAWSYFEALATQDRTVAVKSWQAYSSTISSQSDLLTRIHDLEHVGLLRLFLNDRQRKFFLNDSQRKFFPSDIMVLTSRRLVNVYLTETEYFDRSEFQYMLIDAVKANNRELVRGLLGPAKNNGDGSNFRFQYVPTSTACASSICSHEVHSIMRSMRARPKDFEMQLGSFMSLVDHPSNGCDTCEFVLSKDSRPK